MDPQSPYQPVPASPQPAPANPASQSVPQPTPAAPAYPTSLANVVTPQPAAPATPFVDQVPVAGQAFPAVSASQLGLNAPARERRELNRKKIKIAIAAAAGGLILLFMLLVLTNVVTLTQFKKLRYKSSAGDNYTLQFYTKHSSTKNSSGNTQLVSKVSKDNKLPLTLTLGVGDKNSFNLLKNCVGYKKVFEVVNKKLNQTISVCDALSGTLIRGQDSSGNVYIAGFVINDKTHIITIGQDYSKVDLTDQASAQESLDKFGLAPYRADIEKIVASVMIQ